MTAKEYIENLYKCNRYRCGFCGKEVKGKPTLTLALCKGMSGYDIADICESCYEEIERKAVFSDNGEQPVRT